MIRLKVDPARPEPGPIGRAATTILQGGIVVLPTETLYGLAVDPRNGAAVARVFAVKVRDSRQALPLVAASLEQVVNTLGPLPDAARTLAARFWPGPLTLVVRAPDSVAPGAHDGRGTIGVRVPAHAVPRAVCDAVGWPVTATSANVSGQAATNDPSTVQAGLASRVDLMLDAGATLGGLPSTIVDTSGDEVSLVRPGAIGWEEIRLCLQR